MKRTAALIAILVAGALALPAQDRKKNDPDNATRSVQGAVFDPEDKVVEGAVVQLKDTKSLQVRSFITKPDGTYHFHGLNSNVDYQLKAEHKGLTTSWKTLSVFDDRKVATLNLKLEKK